MENKIESAVNYDDRKKEMTHTTKETKEAKIEGAVIGEVSMESKGVYNVNGIKVIVKDLKNQKAQLEKAISTQKREIKKIPDMTAELEKLKEKLIKLQKIDMAEKQKTQLDSNVVKLKQIKRDLGAIEAEIGTRLKL